MTKDDVIETIYRTCELLDRENFDEWLDLCGTEFKYLITTFSDELGHEMTWMVQDKPGMAHVFSNVENHERYTGKLRRHVSMARVVLHDARRASVESAVAVYHTELNGVSQLYAIGTYKDEIHDIDGRLRLVSRHVVLDTRRLPFGPHVPV